MNKGEFGLEMLYNTSQHLQRLMTPCINWVGWSFENVSAQTSQVKCDFCLEKILHMHATFFESATSKIKKLSSHTTLNQEYITSLKWKPNEPDFFKLADDSSNATGTAQKACEETHMTSQARAWHGKVLKILARANSFPTWAASIQFTRQAGETTLTETILSTLREELRHEWCYCMSQFNRLTIAIHAMSGIHKTCTMDARSL